VITNDHTCTSSGRRKTTTPTSSWVAGQALPILMKKLHMGVKELHCRRHCRINITAQLRMKQCGKEGESTCSVVWKLRGKFPTTIQVEESCF
jgi:hypothetical protein